jgi:hypothetical protein
MPVVDTAKYDKIKETERTSNDIKKKIKDAYIKQEAEKAKPMDKFKEIGKKAPKPPKPQKESNESTEHLKHIKNEMEINAMLREQDLMIKQECVNSEEGCMIKEQAFELLAYPMDIRKRRLFERNLSENVVINECIDKHVITGLMTCLDIRIRAMLYYGMEYHRTNTQYEQLFVQHQMKLQQQQQQEKESSSVTELPDETN